VLKWSFVFNKRTIKSHKEFSTQIPNNLTLLIGNLFANDNPFPSLQSTFKHFSTKDMEAAIQIN